MKKNLKIFYAVLIGVMAASFTACSSDDELDDPSMPESGAWKISEYENLSIRFDGNRSCDRENWAFWQNEFEKEKAKRKIIISKNTSVEDGWFIVSSDESRGNIYRNDLEKVKPVKVEGKTMTASYYLKQYLSPDDANWVVFSADIKLTR